MRKKGGSGHRMKMTPIRERWRGHCACCTKERPLYRHASGRAVCYRCLVDHEGSFPLPSPPPKSEGMPYGAAGRRVARAEVAWQKKVKKRGKDEKNSRLPEPSAQIKGSEDYQERISQEAVSPPQAIDQEWVAGRTVIEKARILWEEEVKKKQNKVE